MRNIKGKGGQVIIEENVIMDRQREYFLDLLGFNDKIETSQNTEVQATEKEDMIMVTVKTMKRLEVGKAAGIETRNGEMHEGRENRTSA